MSEEGLVTEFNSQRNMRMQDYLGLILLIGGVLIAIWVFMNVYSLFTEPEKLTAFQSLVSSHLENLISSSNGESVQTVIPGEILSYAIPLILLMIASGVAGILITGGVRLLDSDVQRLSRKISATGDKLSSKLNSINQELRKKM